MSRTVVVSFEPSPPARAAIEAPLAGLATVTYLPGLDPGRRAAALAGADALLAWGGGADLRDEELGRLGSVGLIQLMSAGVDGVPFDCLPPGVPVAANAGGYAGPMAEHVLAMVLGLAKRLPQNHAAMARGEWDQRTPGRDLRGSVVAILGYGGAGRASADLFRALGARIHAVTRSGAPEDGVERATTLEELDDVLAAADVLLVALSSTRTTRGLIGRRELALMRPDAILVNVARAAIIDEDALYEHLQATPSFSAGLDVWWRESGAGGRFVSRQPFLQLPNVIGSPHVSAHTGGSLAGAARHAAENVARHLRGEPVHHLVDRAEYTGPELVSE